MPAGCLCPSVRLSVCLSLCLSVSLSLCLSVSLSLCLSVSACQSGVSLSLSVGSYGVEHGFEQPLLRRLGGDDLQLLLEVHHLQLQQRVERELLGLVAGDGRTDHGLDFLPVAVFQGAVAEVGDHRDRVLEEGHLLLQLGHDVVGRQGALGVDDRFVECGDCLLHRRRVQRGELRLSPLERERAKIPQGVPELLLQLDIVDHLLELLEALHLPRGVRVVLRHNDLPV